MIFSRHGFYSLRLDKKTENRQDFLRENIAPEHFAMTTQIDFDNQLPRCFARVLLKGETSINCESFEVIALEVITLDFVSNNARVF
jgi:hypothetical protein